MEVLVENGQMVDFGQKNYLRFAKTQFRGIKMNIMTVTDVAELIPNRYPILFIDRG